MCKNLERKKFHYDHYKKLKNDITLLTRRGKKEYYQNYFDENKKNLKKIWKGIKDIVNVKSKNFEQPSCIQDGDKTARTPTLRIFPMHSINISPRLLIIF